MFFVHLMVELFLMPKIKMSLDENLGLAAVYTGVLKYKPIEITSIENADIK